MPTISTERLVPLNNPTPAPGDGSEIILKTARWQSPSQGLGIASRATIAMTMIEFEGVAVVMS